MNAQLSLKRVLKSIEAKLSSEPTPELLNAYTALLEKISPNRAELEVNENDVLMSCITTLQEKFTEMDRRVQFLETLKGVRKLG